MKLRELREQKLLTQRDLAELAGIEQAQIARIEKGQKPTFATIRKLAAALGVPPEDLLVLRAVPAP